MQREKEAYGKVRGLVYSGVSGSKPLGEHCKYT